MQTLDGNSLLQEQGLNHFKSGSAFGALSDDAIRFLLTRGRILRLEDREELFLPGQAGESFFVVLEGQIDYFGDNEKACVLVRTVPFGDQIGYVSMIGLFPRVGASRAHGRAVVLEVSTELFYQLHVEHPFDFGIMMLNLSRDMARTIRKVTGTLVDASTGERG